MTQIHSLFERLGGRSPVHAFDYPLLQVVIRAANQSSPTARLARALGEAGTAFAPFQRATRSPADRLVDRLSSRADADSARSDDYGSFNHFTAEWRR